MNIFKVQLKYIQGILIVLILVAAGTMKAFAVQTSAKPETVRFATFNASLNRTNAGDLIVELSTLDNAQAKVIAEIIQRTSPDILLINEFDFDEDEQAANLLGVLEILCHSIIINIKGVTNEKDYTAI